MMNGFQTIKWPISNRNMVLYQEIPADQREEWIERSMQYGINPDERQLVLHAGQDKQNGLSFNYQQLVDRIRKYFMPIISELTIHWIAVIVSKEGKVLDVFGSNYYLKRASRIKLMKGALLDLENAGINAVSTAMMLEKMVCIQGKEHQLKMFQDWTCICVPIRKEGIVTGYLDLSFSSYEPSHFAVPLLVQTAQRIEERWDSTAEKSDIINHLFEAYGYSPREREVAALWFDNKSALCISSLLGITEGTVRNVIKKIYVKTNVNDKVGFMKKWYDYWSDTRHRSD